ncbi:MAG: hypothetical protein ABI193_17680 [Minicystis sp.]
MRRIDRRVVRREALMRRIDRRVVGRDGGVIGIDRRVVGRDGGVIGRDRRMIGVSRRVVENGWSCVGIDRRTFGRSLRVTAIERQVRRSGPHVVQIEPRERRRDRRVIEAEHRMIQRARHGSSSPRRPRTSSIRRSSRHGDESPRRTRAFRLLTLVTRTIQCCPMRSPFDQLVKRLAREGFAPGGHVETEAEVSPDPQRIDVWFWPDASRVRKVVAPLGLFGRMGLRSCTLEPFHRTPTGAQVVDCLVKHRLFCRDLARRTPRPPAPLQWIICAERPTAALAGLCFRRSRLGPGIYDGPPLLRSRIVMVSELPRTRDTLLVRLMGAGETLKLALQDAWALPPDAVESGLALPILVTLRFEVPAELSKQTEIDREFLRMTTEEYKKWMSDLKQEALKEGEAQGVAQGLAKGVANAVLTVYRARFGAPPASLVSAVESVSDRAALDRWLVLVSTATEEEVAAALPKRRAKPAARPTSKPRSTAARRAPAAR